MAGIAQFMLHTRTAQFVLSCLILITNVTSAQENGFLLAKGKAGFVEIGMTIDAAQAKYGRETTKLVAHYPEGMFEPMLEVYLPGHTSMTAPALLLRIEQDNGWIIDGIGVNDARFRTRAGIGVGSTLGEIRRVYRISYIAFGEGPLVANVEELQMTFELDFNQPPREWYKSGDQRLIPDRAKVTAVYLYRAR